MLSKMIAVQTQAQQIPDITFQVDTADAKQWHLVSGASDTYRCVLSFPQIMYK